MMPPILVSDLTPRNSYAENKNNERYRMSGALFTECT
jgi:hypothetical protein